MGYGTRLAGKIARGTLITLIGRVVNYPIILLTGMAIPRLLGPTAYGLVPLVLSFVSVLAIVADFGMTPALVKYTAHYAGSEEYGKLRGIASSSAKLMIGLRVLCGLPYFLLADFVANSVFGVPESALFIRISAVTFMLAGLGNVFPPILQGLQRQGYRVSLSVLSNCSYLAISVAIILAGYGVLGVFMGSFLTQVVVIVAAVAVFYWKIFLPFLRGVRGVSDFNARGVLLSYGKLAFISTILYTVTVQLPVLLLKSYGGTLEEIAFYSIGIGVSEFAIMTPISEFYAVLFPAVSELHGKGRWELIRETVRRTTKYLTVFAMFMGVAVIVFARELILIIYDEPYLGAAAVLVFLAAVPIIRGIDTGPSSVVDGTGRIDIYVKANVIGLATYLLVGVTLIPRLGLMGAVFTTLVYTVIAHAFIYLSVMRGVIRTSIPWITFVKPMLAAIGAGLVVYLLPRPFPPLVTGIFYGSLYTVVFIFGVILIGGMDRSDLAFLEKILQGYPRSQRILSPIMGIFGWVMSLCDRISGRH